MQRHNKPIKQEVWVHKTVTSQSQVNVLISRFMGALFIANEPLSIAEK